MGLACLERRNLQKGWILTPLCGKPEQEFVLGPKQQAGSAAAGKEGAEW